MREAQLFTLPLCKFPALLLGCSLFLPLVNSYYYVVGNETVAVTAGDALVYPVPDTRSNPVCPDATWKSWALHESPTVYNPFEWDRAEWKDYLRDYVITATILSLVLFGIAVAAGLAFIIWRCIQWMAGCWCNRCCRAGREDPLFLGDHKHSVFKLALASLIIVAIGLTMWGMIIMDEQLLATFWRTVQDILNYGNNASSTLSSIQFQLINGTFTLLRDSSYWVIDHLDGLVNATAQVALRSDLLQNAAASLGPAGSLNTTMGMLLPVLGSLTAAVSGSSSQGGGSGGERRALASSANITTAGVLVVRLAVAVPIVQTIPYQQSTQFAALQELLNASAAVQAMLWGENDDANAALDEALHNTKLREWLLSWEKIVEELQLLQSAASSSSLDNMLQLADTASQDCQQARQAASSLEGSMGATSAKYIHGSRSALSNLKGQIDSVNATMADSQLTVDLRNGTAMPLSNIIDTSLDMQDSYVATEQIPAQVPVPSRRLTSNSITAATAAAAATANAAATVAANAAAAANTAAAANNTSRQGAPSPHQALPAQQVYSALVPLKDGLASVVFTVEDAANATAALNASLSNLSPADMNATQAYIESVYIPPLNALSSPLFDVVTRATTYGIWPSSDNLELLQGALRDAQPQMLAAAAALASLPPSYPALDVQLTNLTATVEATNVAYAALINTTQGLTLTWGVMGLDELLTGLTDVLGYADQLPDDGDIVIMVREQVALWVKDINDTLNALQDSARDVADGLGGTSTALLDDVVATCNTWLDTYQDNFDYLAYVVYCVWMAMFGLVILALLVLLPALYYNHGASLLVTTTVLLVLLIAGQAVCVLLAGGMAVLEDACDNLERVAIQELAQSSSPNNAIPASFYLYKVPTTLDDMLWYTYNLNVTKLLETVAGFKADIVENVGVVFPNQPQFQLMVAEALVSINYLNNSVAELLVMISYDRVHPLYLNPKTVVCCDAGNFAYYEWCATTSLAFFLFVIIVGLLYLVARMDMTPTKGCCRCCHCRPVRVPYRLGVAQTWQPFSHHSGSGGEAGAAAPTSGDGKASWQKATEQSSAPTAVVANATVQAYAQPKPMLMMESSSAAMAGVAVGASGGKQAAAPGGDLGSVAAEGSSTHSASVAHIARGASAPLGQDKPAAADG